MVNRIIIWLVSFCLGALSAVFWPRLPSKIEFTILFTILFALCLLLILLYRYSKYGRYQTNTFVASRANAGKGIYCCCLVLCGCVAGALLEASVGHYHYAWQLPNDKIQKEITIRARVLKGGCVPSDNMQSDLTDISDKNYRYLVRFIALESTVSGRNYSQTNTQNRKVTQLHRLVTEAENTAKSEEESAAESGAELILGKKGLLTTSTYTSAKSSKAEHCIHNGDEFTAVVKLKPRYSTQNPVGFNKQKQLMVDNIHVTGYIKNLNWASVTHKHSFRLRMATALNNIDIKNRIWWQALLVGIRVNFDKSHWYLLQVTGTGHLFSISGMHLGVVAAYTLLLGGGFILIASHAKIVVTHLASLLHFPPGFAFLQLPSRLIRTLSPVLSIKYRIMVIGAVWIVCGFYAALSGLALPVVRAFVLLTIASLLSVLFVAYRPIHLATAMIALSISLFPLSILSASFYLSVCAVLYIWFLATRFPTANGSRLKTLLVLQLLLGLFMAPLTIMFFNSVSIAGLVANIVAVPVITLLLPPALIILLVLTVMQNSGDEALYEDRAEAFFHSSANNTPIDIYQAGVLLSSENNYQFSEQISESLGDKVYFLAESLFIYLDKALSWLLSFLLHISQYDWAAIPINIDSTITACLLISMLIFIAPPWRYKRHALLILIIPMFTHYLPSNSDEWKVHVLDAGQANAIVIIKAGRAVVIDSGASYRNLAYTASSVLLPLLKREGVKAIDIVVHTHKDNDHAGGKAALASSPLAQDALWFSPTKNCELGRVERWQGLAIHFLWPKAGNTINNNDHSCVIKITDGQQSILLPGDIERTTEYAILSLPFALNTRQLPMHVPIHTQAQTQVPLQMQTHGINKNKSHYKNSDESRNERHHLYLQTDLKADVLVAPHHGSNTSSTAVFLKNVAPKAAIFTQGFENRWRFPAKEVVARYEALGIPYYMTSFHGSLTITFLSSGSRESGFTVYSQRLDLNKRWYLDARYPTHL
jgi:competence protein ComEC